MNALVLDVRLAPLAAVALAVVVAVLRTPSLRPTSAAAGPWLGFCILVWSGMAAEALPPGPGVAVVGLGVLLLLGAAVRRLALPVRTGGRAAATATGPLLVLVAVTWMVGVDLLGTRSGAARWTADVASLVLLLSVLIFVRRGGLDRAWPATAATLGLAACVVVSGLAGTAWTACHADKCTPFGQLLSGPYHSENLIALYAAFTLATVIAGWSGVPRVLGVTFCALVVAYSGSRTALYAVAVAVAVPLLLEWRRSSAVAARRDRERAGAVRAGTAGLPWPARLLLLVPAAAACLGLWLVLSADPRTLSARGLVWLRARSVLEGRWGTGLGLSRYEELQGVGLLSHHFAHSQYLTLAFAGGMVAVAVFTFGLTVTLRTSLRTSGSAGSGAPAVAVLVLGLTEVVWNPLTVDGMSWIVATVLITAGHRGAAGTTAEPGATPAALRTGDDSRAAQRGRPVEPSRVPA